MKRVFVITGTPGVGKTTIIKRLRKALVGCKVYNATDLINKYKAYKGKDRFGTKIANLKELRGIILNLLAKENAQIIILDGHILCEFDIPNAKVIVIRNHLDIIKKRLLKRDYPVPKIRDNIVSEALDYCGSKARENYKEVYEIMNGRSAYSKILRMILGKGKLSSEEIALLKELKIVIKESKKFAI